MSLARLLNQPLTIQTMGVATKDIYGNTIQAPAGVPVAGVGLLDQKDTIEYVNGRDTVVTKWKCFLPASTLIGKLDYINFGGQKFQVDGEPYQVYNPRLRAVSHIECKLIEVT